MYKIVKQFKFEAAHQLYSQNLEREDLKGTIFDLGSNPKNACRKTHGHSSKIDICLESEDLENSMVLDFSHFKWFKEYLDEHFDHRFLISQFDPKAEELKKIIPDSLNILCFLPTAENLSEYFYRIWKTKLRIFKGNIKIKYVRVWETETAYAEYYEK